MSPKNEQDESKEDKSEADDSEEDEAEGGKSDEPAAGSGEAEPAQAAAPDQSAQPRRGRRSVSARAGKPDVNGVDSSAVRAWAAANGLTVSPRGRIKDEVLEAYSAAGNRPTGYSQERPGLSGPWALQGAWTDESWVSWPAPNATQDGGRRIDQAASAWCHDGGQQRRSSLP
jgi:hypothetical protein